MKMQLKKQLFGLSLILSLLISNCRCNDIINVGEKTESVPTTLLLPTIATTTSTLSTQMALEKDSTEQMNYKNIVMSLYVPITKLGPCRYIDGTRKQNHQCRRDPGLADALRDAKNIAMGYCKEQFKFDRWNCSIETKGKRNIFKKVYKETAFVHALTAAALTYQISRACAEGKMSRCQCATERRPAVNDPKKFQWGGCSDNVKHGKRVARNFLELQTTDNDNDEQSYILRHDGEVGIVTLANHMETKCKCHGVSGSCTMKTCWRKLSDFNATAAALRVKYHQALRKVTYTKASRRAAKREQRERVVTIGTGFNGRNFGILETTDPDYETLFYLEQSPTFCALTKGRQCSSPENCANLCCGRGYTTRVIKQVEKCKCRFANNRCCTIVCDYCERYEDRYYCK
ncbi:protein Wnt-4 isoform X1 [Chironomus tepperi]|uniref:protein Wnt-4 isoform X1 n=2 Tax=Chironomus tepperi TaxID=113505 RepID=UPI00391F7EC2